MKQTASGEGYLTQYMFTLIAATNTSKLTSTAPLQGNILPPFMEWKGIGKEMVKPACYVGCM